MERIYVRSFATKLFCNAAFSGGGAGAAVGGVGAGGGVTLGGGSVTGFGAAIGVGAVVACTGSGR